MHRYLIPDEKLNSIYDVDFGHLREKGISNLIIDLDNTLTSWNNPDITSSLLEWVKEAQRKRFRICILSNNGKGRVSKYAQKLGVTSVWNAGKPWKGAYKKAMKALDADQDACAVIGDQIFTDTLGGNRMGLYTILVDPVSRREFIGTRFVRIFESMVLKKLGY